MKNNNYHIFKTVPRSNRKIVEGNEVDTTHTHTHVYITAHSPSSFSLFDLLKKLCSETKILSNYIPSLQRR
jgi:hypothetical protein